MKRKILLGLLLLFCVALAIYNQTFTGIFPITYILILCIVLHIHLLYTSRKISINQNVNQKEYQHNEKIEYILTVENKGILPIFHVALKIIVRDSSHIQSKEIEIHESFCSRESKSIAVPISSEHVGNFEIYLHSCTLIDMFSVFSKKCKLNFSDKIYIQPNRINTSSEEYGIVQADYTGVREYALGDSLKHIHWKLSAHTKGLMTKTYESKELLGASILLNLHVNDLTPGMIYDTYDKMIEAAYSIASYCLENNTTSSIHYFNKNEKKSLFANSFEELNEYFRNLPYLSYSSSNNFIRNVDDFFSTSSNQVQKVIFTTEFPNKLSAHIDSICSTQRYIKIFLVKPNEIVNVYERSGSYEKIVI